MTSSSRRYGNGGAGLWSLVIAELEVGWSLCGEAVAGSSYVDRSITAVICGIAVQTGGAIGNGRYGRWNGLASVYWRRGTLKGRRRASRRGCVVARHDQRQRGRLLRGSTDCRSIRRSRGGSCGVLSRCGCGLTLCRSHVYDGSRGRRAGSQDVGNKRSDEVEWVIRLEALLWKGRCACRLFR